MKVYKMTKTTETKYNKIHYKDNELKELIDIMARLSVFISGQTLHSVDDDKWNVTKSIMAKIGNSVWSVIQSQKQRIETCLNVMSDLESKGIDARTKTNEQGRNEYITEQMKIPLFESNIIECKTIEQLMTHAVEHVMKQKMLRGQQTQKAVEPMSVKDVRKRLANLDF